MTRKYLRRDFFWQSYFEAGRGKKTWVSRQSYLTGFVSSLAGIMFTVMLYLTVGAAIRLSYSAFSTWTNFFFFFFSILFFLLLLVVVFVFFKDLFSAVKIEYSNGVFTLERSVAVRRRPNLFFLREKETVKSELKSIEYTKVFYDFLAEKADFFYLVYFIFRNREEITYPVIYSTTEVVSSLVEHSPKYAGVKFGHFTKSEAEKIAKFFGVPPVYRE